MKLGSSALIASFDPCLNHGAHFIVCHGKGDVNLLETIQGQDAMLNNCTFELPASHVCDVHEKNSTRLHALGQ